ncbi:MULTISPECIES: D-tagatose-bisphosphate aldolase, class II, non-catalytic subunit [Burkholderia]|uniref:D-tagatose-1,6-bisphosphate aldolase subunit GatZ/KbaZ n=1 Tax=Burkholderia pyrrocinia TaxID=60550 RepID=A0A318IM93_BURPY|nr:MULTISPECIES: D-tagatose-bisphosphate aldolase, class II, non-catalytic subunit [Burkholderia]PXX37096.1 D-tagatose-1,6-bisphosphate aldolase subunit GatZ/KbaZ [Burkholderia pyrrocinia]SFW49611.1 D-tagatose-1,6-bisphosphate aldolase subunit GatZ/KbaZ [Burkholderia sp. NFACC33-1]SFX99146.1 D-tagatose-1,6-bisphosphate aldolase subunit GatZ/KbaZ [Burkholderia sp. NFPP32]
MNSTLVQSMTGRAGNVGRLGFFSVCTAHPVVIEAALRHALVHDVDVLIEATCNQVNQEGGYTGMTPAAFRQFVAQIALKVGFNTERLILGGDHLGPTPWKKLSSDVAMARAEVMIADYVHAGFRKLHIDASMGCHGEPEMLSDEVVAQRAVRLVRSAEAAASREAPPLYVIGTEVPVPGGALEVIDHLEVTRPSAAKRTIDVHRAAFEQAGLSAAFDRVIGVVVQPGVEFGHQNVIVYRPERARDLGALLSTGHGYVFEAHSTDYQPAGALAELVRDGFAILKVGPGLTFAYREALYGLDAIAQVLAPVPESETLTASMERLMVARPEHWEKYYHGTEDEIRVQRHFSYSDRIRYYWALPEAQAAVNALLERLDGMTVPETLVSQYLSALYPAVRSGAIQATPAVLLEYAVSQVFDTYHKAVTGP